MTDRKAEIDKGENASAEEPYSSAPKPNEIRQDPERVLTRSGIRLFKYWFSVTKAEQDRRFAARLKLPLKQWKLSLIDQ